MQDLAYDELNKKVDKILFLLTGTEHQPGLMERIERAETILHGSNGAGGIVQKVNFMWRAHVWFIGGVGTVFGAVLTYLINHVK